MVYCYSNLPVITERDSNDIIVVSVFLGFF